LESVTLLPSTDNSEILLSPSRVTSAVLPSGEKATALGPDLASPSEILPPGLNALPASVNTETVPSERLATRTRLPALLMAIPAAPAPASTVPTTLGGEVFRSMIETLLSGTTFFGSAGSILVAAVTSATDSSGATATLEGGPTTLVGALISATIFGGDVPRSMIVTASGAGFCTTVFTPSISTALLSLAETAICAMDSTVQMGRARSARALTRERRDDMIFLPCSV
jgi:hypothetical protein